MFTHSVRLSTNNTSPCGLVISKIEPPLIGTSNLLVVKFHMRPSGNGSHTGVANFSLDFSFSVIAGILS